MHGETLLRVAYLAGAVVDASAAIGMAFPDRFGASLRYSPPFDVGRAEFRYGMRYGAPLMAGWTVLLVWAFFDPVARRDVLLMTIVPVVAGLMLHDARARRGGELRRGPVLAIRSLQLVLIALFATAYLASFERTEARQGDAGGPPIAGEVDDALIPDAVERAMDDAGFETAHLVGNSLGGFVALQLAARGRARSVVAFAPAGGWAKGDESFKETLALQARMHEQLQAAAPHADALVASVEGRRRATALITTNFEHIPAELLAHQLLGLARCDAAPLIEYAMRAGYRLEPEKITCPVRIVWGTNDKLLPWPSAAARFRDDWLPSADWVELDGIGHCPQLDIPLETAQLIIGFTAAHGRQPAWESPARSA